MTHPLPDLRELHRGFEDHAVLNSASAISFQILSALAVAGLVLLALAVLHLSPLLVPVDGLVLGALSVVVRWTGAAPCCCSPSA